MPTPCPSSWPKRQLAWRRTLSALALLSPLLHGTPAAADEPAGGARALRLAVSNGPVSLPIYVADAQGHFKAEGLDVRLQPCVSGRACVEALQAGRADVATAAELVVAVAPAGAEGLRIVATISSSTQHIKLVARRASGIARPADLRGKRIASTAGTSAQYFLDSWLLYQDIDPGSVSVVSRPPGELAPALVRGEVDAIAIWEPIASGAVAALAGEAVVLPSPRIYTQHFGLVAGSASIGARRDDLVRLLRALDKAQRSIAADPQAARGVLARRDAAGLHGLRIEEHSFRLRLEQSLVATMEAQSRWAGAAGAPDMLGRIDDSMLRAAVPGAVDLVQQRSR